MKYSNHIWIASLMLALLAPGRALHAHGGEDHGDAAPAPPIATGAESELLTSFGASEQFELLIKYPAPAVKSPTRIRVYLSDYATNRPVTGASFVLASRPSGVVATESPRMISAGIYEMAVTFPKDTVYSLTATIVAGATTGAVTLDHVYAGEAAEHFLEEHAGTAAGEETKGSSLWMIVGTAVVLIIAAFAAAVISILRRRGARASATDISRRDQSTVHPRGESGESNV